MDLSSESGRLRCTVVFTTDKTAPLLSIANATTADVDTVLAIWNEGLRSAPADGGPHDWEMSQHMALEWVLGHQQQMRPLWLARLGDQPVALLSFIGFS